MCIDFHHQVRLAHYRIVIIIRVIIVIIVIFVIFVVVAAPPHGGCWTAQW